MKKFYVFSVIVFFLTNMPYFLHFPSLPGPGRTTGSHSPPDADGHRQRRHSLPGIQIEPIGHPGHSRSAACPVPWSSGNHHNHHPAGGLPHTVQWLVGGTAATDVLLVDQTGLV